MEFEFYQEYVVEPLLKPRNKNEVFKLTLTFQGFELGFN